MTKLTVGDSHDESKLRLEIRTYEGSTSEVVLGHAYGLSSREIVLLETHRADLSAELRNLEFLLRQSHVSGASPILALEAAKVAVATKATLESKKWYSISAEGILEAAKAVGQTATPLVSATMKVIELLSKVKL